MTKKTSNRFSPEVRQRAVRMVLEPDGSPLEQWISEPVLPVRFASKARASLPGLSAANELCGHRVQVAMALQRTRLRQDQGIPEWMWRL